MNPEINPFVLAALSLNQWKWPNAWGPTPPGFENLSVQEFSRRSADFRNGYRKLLEACRQLAGGPEEFQKYYDSRIGPPDRVPDFFDAHPSR